MKLSPQSAVYSSHSSQLAQRRKLLNYVKLCLVMLVIAGALVGFKVHASTVDTLSPTLISKTAASTSKPQLATGNGSATAKPVSATATKPSTVVATTPNCVAQPSTGGPTAVPVNAYQPGLHVTPVSVNSYTVYGNTANQVSNQINACTPVVIDGIRYTASTDYIISWSFSIASNETGFCTIAQASVGLAISQTFPSWQATQSANTGLAGSWEAFMANLTAHENGHAQLDQTYAATILSDLQNFPPTDCANIVSSANSKANQDVAALNQANDAYDNATNHGLTQGAVLAIR